MAGLRVGVLVGEHGDHGRQDIGQDGGGGGVVKVEKGFLAEGARDLLVVLLLLLLFFLW